MRRKHVLDRWMEQLPGHMIGDCRALVICEQPDVEKARDFSPDDVRLFRILNRPQPDAIFDFLAESVEDAEDEKPDFKLVLDEWLRPEEELWKGSVHSRGQSGPNDALFYVKFTLNPECPGSGSTWGWCARPFTEKWALAFAFDDCGTFTSSFARDTVDCPIGLLDLRDVVESMTLLLQHDPGLGNDSMRDQESLLAHEIYSNLSDVNIYRLMLAASKLMDPRLVTMSDEELAGFRAPGFHGIEAVEAMTGAGSEVLEKWRRAVQPEP